MQRLHTNALCSLSIIHALEFLIAAPFLAQLPGRFQSRRREAWQMELSVQLWPTNLMCSYLETDQKPSSFGEINALWIYTQPINTSTFWSDFTFLVPLTASPGQALMDESLGPFDLVRVKIITLPHFSWLPCPLTSAVRADFLRLSHGMTACSVTC